MDFRQFCEETKAMPNRFRKPMPLPKEVKQIYRAFQDANSHIYVAGGAVRDHLRGLKPKDYDLATVEVPDEVKRILTRAGIGYNEIGVAFGVVNAHLNGEDYEIATFREDLEAKRDTEVRFFDKAQEEGAMRKDAQRRDLTINALFYDISSGDIIDFVGGVEDLKAGQVKTVGNPYDRFNEDPLRVLRYIRFFTRVNPGGIQQMDKETLAAARQFIDNGLKGESSESVSPERIKDEFGKGLKSALNPKHYLQIYYTLGLLTNYVFKNLNVDPTFREDSNNLVMTVAHILRNNDASKLRSTLNRLKYSNTEVNRIVYLVNLMRLTKTKRSEKEEIALGQMTQPKFLQGFRKQQQEFTDEELEQWAKWQELDPQAIKTARAYRLRNRDEIPGAMELEGPELGDYIARHNAREMWPSFANYLKRKKK